VSSKSTKNAASDVQVAQLLAMAGIGGALANVDINLPLCNDEGFKTETVLKVRSLRQGMDALKSSLAHGL
jgi:formiminotetrahydrofolate cyclodeaminase